LRQETPPGFYQFILSIALPLNYDASGFSAEFGVEPWVSTKEHWNAIVEEGVAGVDGVGSLTIEKIEQVVASRKQLLRDIHEQNGKTVLTLSLATRVIPDTDPVPNFLLGIGFPVSFLVALADAYVRLVIQVWEPDEV